MSVELQIIKNPDSEDISFVRESLKSYNSQFTSSIPFSKPLAVNLVLKENNSVVAGLLGYIYWGCFHIDILWIDDSYRKQGYGTHLLEKAEEIAKENKCSFIHLDTLSFQAQGFYIKNGYSVFGELDGYPDGIKRYYMKKEI